MDYYNQNNDNNNNNNNNNNEKGRRIFLTSFLTFMIIALLQSCQEARLRKEAMTGQIIDSNIPKVTYEDIMKDQQKTDIEILEERMRELTERIQDEEEMSEELPFSK